MDAQAPKSKPVVGQRSRVTTRRTCSTPALFAFSRNEFGPLDDCSLQVFGKSEEFRVLLLLGVLNQYHTQVQTVLMRLTELGKYPWSFQHNSVAQCERLNNRRG